MSFFSAFGRARGVSEPSGSQEARLDEMACGLGDEAEDKAAQPASEAELRTALADVRLQAEEKMADDGGDAERMERLRVAEANVRFARPLSADRKRATAEAKEAKVVFLEKQKSSSTSSVYLKSTIQVPDVDRILLSAAVLLEKMVSRGSSAGDDPFSASCVGRGAHRECGARVAMPVTVDSIFAFSKNAFLIAQWSPECNIIALVLITRLVGSTEVTLTERNWDKILLCALLLAQKLWDDTPLANIDFPVLWRRVFGVRQADFDLRAFNLMEKAFLEKLHFDIHVDRSTYTRFYFELHALTEDSSRSELSPISERHALTLEARSSQAQRELDCARMEWRQIELEHGGSCAAADDEGRACSADVGRRKRSSFVKQASFNQYNSRGGLLVLD